MNTSIITGPGPASLPPLVNDVKQWDAMLRYQAASQNTQAPLAVRVKAARDAGFDLPQGTPRPWTQAVPRDQIELLAQFNAVVDAVAQYGLHKGAGLGLQPRDVAITELFAFQAPKPGYFVRFSAAGVAQEIAVYRRG